MQRQRNVAFVAIFVFLIVVVAACIEDLRLAPCSEEEGNCQDGMECRKGRCFNIIPDWEVPPCSSPAAKGRCCDMEQTVIPDNGNCRLPLLDDADAISAPSLGPDGTVVVAVREGTELSVVAVRPDGSKAWREVVDNAHAGTPSIVRVANDGRAFMDNGDALWTRSQDGAVTTLSVDGQIDGGFAVCADGVVVALVRGPDERGVVRLGEPGEDIGDWQLGSSLDILPVLPPAVSIPDNVVVTAWEDGTIVVHDLTTGALSNSWSSPNSETGITGLALDGLGHLWVSTGCGRLERLSLPVSSERIDFKMDQTEEYIQVDLGTSIYTPPVLTGDGEVVVALENGDVVRNNGNYSNTKDLITTLITTAPGTLALLEGGGLLLLGDCPSGRCLSIYFQQSDEFASFFGAAFEYEGEHRHSGLSAESTVGLPRGAGLAALEMYGRLDGLMVAGPARTNAPWPGPDGGPGNGRCAEGTQ